MRPELARQLPRNVLQQLFYPAPARCASSAEVRAFARRKVGRRLSPETARLAFLAAMARGARKYYLGLVAISQDVGDFLGSVHSRTALANPALKLLLKQDPSAIEAVAAALHLSAEERRFLLAA